MYTIFILLGHVSDIEQHAGREKRDEGFKVVVFDPPFEPGEGVKENSGESGICLIEI